MHNEGGELISHKFEIGASVKHVSLDNLPLSSHAFCQLDGRQFRVRSHNYEPSGSKTLSDSNMAEIIGIDVFKTDQKLPRIMRYINIPDEFLRPNDARTTDMPRLFVVNFMLPDYAPSNPLWGKSKIDGKGYSVVFYIKINWEFDNAECTAADLLKKFLQMDCVSAADFDLRSRLKGIPVLLNPENVKVGLPLRQLIKKYSGKPFLTGPKYHYYSRTDSYLECDVDVHQWIYPARKTLHT